MSDEHVQLRDGNSYAATFLITLSECPGPLVRREISKFEIVFKLSDTQFEITTVLGRTQIRSRIIRAIRIEARGVLVGNHLQVNEIGV